MATTPVTKSDDIQSSNSEMRKSSFFHRARVSFFRSQGQRGADVDNLRGTTGADFEGEAKVGRSAPPTSCLCFDVLVGSRAGHSKHAYVVVKGPFCFVFSGESATAPRYAIGLQYMRPQCSGAVVSLNEACGTVSYDIVLNSAEDASLFSKAVKRQAESAEVEIVRKRLGHADLLKKRRSVMYAEEIALEKERNQPPKPMSTSEIINSMATLQMAAN